MKKEIVVCLLFLHASLAWSQSTTPIDSTFVKEVESMIKTANQLLYDQPDSAKTIVETALIQSKSQNYLQGQANAYNILGVVSDIKGDFGQSFSYHKKAHVLYLEIGDQRGAANCQSNMAIILKQDKKYDEALSYLEDSYTYYESVDDKRHMASSLMTMAGILLENGQALDLVIEKHKKSESIVRSVNDTMLICSSLNLQGDAYLKHKKFDQAIQHYQAAIDIIKDKNRPWNVGYSHLGLAKAFLETRQAELALQNCNDGIMQYEKINHKYGIKELLKIKVEAYEQLKSYHAALTTLKKYQSHNDSLYNEKQSNQIRQLKAEFDTEKKEVEIAYLSQQATIQSLELQQKNQMILIGLIVVVFGAFGSYLYVQRKAAKNREARTEVEQRFLRSQLNPHFIFNALMAIQNFMLKNSAEEAAMYLGKFSKLMREILENSRQEFIPVEAEVEMLTNYLEIHKMRLNNAFNYEINIDDNIDPEIDTIPPMFVQPFVENAIEHGIIDTHGDGMIQLTFRKENEHIAIEVIDNGGGMQHEVSGKTHRSLATTIIQERMALFNKSLKDKIQVVISDLKATNDTISGTRIELKVPFRYS